MKRYFFPLLLIGTNALASPQLAKSRNCMSCHMVDSVIMGPSFKSIAERYKGQKDIEKVLLERVQKGSVGQWGKTQMPVNPQVTKEEAQLLVKWILEQ